MILNIVVAIAVAASTWMIGWWAVAIVALVAGFVMRNRGGRAWTVALGAIEGWAFLLLIDSFGGRSRELLSMLAGTMNIPGPLLVIATLLFPALIGWSGAALAAELGRFLYSPDIN